MTGTRRMVGITRRHAELIEARGLDIEVLDRLGITSSDRLGADTIAIPYFQGEHCVGTKYRTIAGEKMFTQEKGSKQIFYNWNCLTDPNLSNEAVIVTEGEPDCWSALQAGYSRVVSVPGGAPSTEVGERAAAKYDFIETMPELPEDTVFILATDGDDPGAALRADLALRLGQRRCRWVKYPKGCKDLNDALRLYGQRGVVEAINRAQWVIGNIFRLADIPPLPAAKAYESGFPGLDERYRLRLGDFCVVTGTPGSGKSAFIGDVACRMVSQHRWPVCFASFEQEPTRDHRRMLRSWYGGGMEVSLDQETVANADKWINEWFSFIVANPDEPTTLPWVMERMAVAALRFGARLCVLDPWNEVEHDRPDGMSLTEYVGMALREFRAFARKYEVHFIVAAHPAKMRRENGRFPIPTLYDISDSAMWANRSDVGIIVHRKNEDETLIRVAKSRYHDQIGKPGDVAVRYLWQQATYQAFSAQSEMRYGEHK